MRMHPTALKQDIPITGPGIERLNVDQFHRMIKLGILHEGEPIELIDGILVRKDNSDRGADPMTHGPKHALCIQRCRELEGQLRPHPYHLRQQLPITLSAEREPEPDIAIVRGGIEDYQDHHPVGSDCLMVIEVADSSLEYDRTTKVRMYAAAGIFHYWIVNIQERQIEVYESPIPAEERYAKRTDFQVDDTVRLLLDPDTFVDVEVRAILP